MTRCNSTSDPLNATGDIVGYGILAAFLGSALVTIFAVLLAYYYDTIDDDLMTDLDDEFKDEVRTIIRKCKGRVKNVRTQGLSRRSL
ncbi:hypothetical protein CGCF415_v009968 [Colletotrichum fructicola]|nr:hypothetical protein CGCFRS4_v010235 [Colletotrichum fructicola]KAF4900937.1 hypothetical protein CGCF415_v009968 [Colletotrichum fructicola]KAF4934249.1 hypothetical protein CGCF245_v008710 [Colletotrichum fructicola]